MRRSKEATSDLIDKRDSEMHNPDEIISRTVKAFTQIQGTGGYYVLVGWLVGYILCWTM
jgi:hypothetical protein